MTEPEIITVAISADINGDGRIDYEEFMKHFSDCLRMVRLQSTLQEAYDLYQKQITGSQGSVAQKLGASKVAL